jgi:ribbon-helix-helix CopG family protein
VNTAVHILSGPFCWEEETMTKQTGNVEPRVQTITQVSVPVFEKMNKLAQQEGVSRSEIQRRAIERFVKDADRRESK